MRVIIDRAYRSKPHSPDVNYGMDGRAEPETRLEAGLLIHGHRCGHQSGRARPSQWQLASAASSILISAAALPQNSHLCAVLRAKRQTCSSFAGSSPVPDAT